jgi:trimeric autotransporter adhesin
MKTPGPSLALAALLLAFILHTSYFIPSAAAQPTAFTYQGFLTENGGPANGASDFEFKLYNAASAGAQQGSTVTFDDVGVTNGLFTVTLDFGNQFPGAARWLEIGVRTNGGGAFSTLNPRQSITATPYAIKAANAMTVAMGTISDPSFFGTTTTAPLQLQVSNTVGLRLEYPTLGTVPNLVGGYSSNSVGAGTSGAVIAGGGAFGAINSIGANSAYSAIGGGAVNKIASDSAYATIAGGYYNDIGAASYGTSIGGGYDNNIAANSGFATIAGGQINDIRVDSHSSAIGGGYGNLIFPNSPSATIAGGQANVIREKSYLSAIGGGFNNFIQSNAPYAVIPGGYLNTVGAGATNAFAAGYRAKANHVGAFVWADSQIADFASTTNNQFSIRALGGVRLSDDTRNLSFGSATRQMLNLWNTNYAIGVQNFGLYSRTDVGGGFYWFTGGSHNNAAGNAGGGSTMMSLTGGGLAVNGTFVSASDRNKKENFKPVDARAVLAKVAALPLSEWNYKSDTASRHLGPMAQDFYAAFGVGPDDKHIATVDADGVALAAIQGLNQKLTAELTRRDAENAEMKQELAELKRMLVRLSAKGN